MNVFPGALLSALNTNGFPINTSRFTVASAAATADIWASPGGNEIDFTGTATVNLSDDTLYRYVVKGKYSAKKDKAALTLKAANDESRGSSIKIKNLAVSARVIDSAKVSYKIMGHKGKALVD